MTKLEKVVNALELCTHPSCEGLCKYCGYNNQPKCLIQKDIDALELLKVQQPRVLTWKELIDVTDPVWYEERDGISSWALCIDVTRGNAYEDMSYEFFENYDNSYIREYADKCNVYWRCWTARPTDEQRKAVKWDD